MYYRLSLASLLVALAGCSSQPLTRSPSSVDSLRRFRGVNLQCFNSGTFVSLGFTHGVIWVNDVFGEPVFSRLESTCASSRPSESGSCEEKDGGLTCHLGARNSLLRVEYSDLKAPDQKDAEQGHWGALFGGDANFNNQKGWRCYVYDASHSPSRDDENPGDCGGG